VRTLNNSKIITIPYQPRALQRELHNELKRFSVIVAHRRFGKTTFCINHLIKSALTARHHSSRFAYVAPLYRQAKTVAWDMIKHYTSTIPSVKYNESELRVDFPNGSRITLFGSDNPDSLRGIGLLGVVLDEVAQMKEDVWGSVIRPTLSDQKGYAIFIGTPKGLDSFYDIYDKALIEDDWYTNIYKASETGILDADELEAAKRDITFEDYMREYECSFTVPSAMGFDREWLRYWTGEHYRNLNLYILVDPANEKKKKSDYTSMMVIGMGDDNNYYIIDMVRDRLNLTERTEQLIRLHRKYEPIAVGYEKYGKDSDIQHIEYVMEQENYRFGIVPLGGSMSKEDRIRKLIPLFQNSRIWIPHNCVRQNTEGDLIDLTKIFINKEYLAFPVGQHDDMIDCLARITDPDFIMRSPQPKRRHRLRDKRAKTKYNVLSMS